MKHTIVYTIVVSIEMKQWLMIIKTNKKDIPKRRGRLKYYLGDLFVLYNMFLKTTYYYIMPGMPPPPIGGIAGASSLISIKAHSVVSIIPATEAAFSNAIRVTFLGSIIPAFSMSTYSSDFAS